MNIESSGDQIPFSPGDWVIDKNNPGQPGQYTGKCHKAGPHIIVSLIKKIDERKEEKMQDI